MNDVEGEIYARLDALGISYDRASHAGVHTMEDCRVPEALLHACMPKNLFLTPRNQSQFYLCIVHPERMLRTAVLSKQIGSSRLSFGSPERLMQMMRTLPGAISPLGLLFDAEHAIRLLVDDSLRDEARLAFHPCVNTASVAMTGEMFFQRYLPAIGCVPEFVRVEDSE